MFDWKICPETPLYKTTQHQPAGIYWIGENKIHGYIETIYGRVVGSWDVEYGKSLILRYKDLVIPEPKKITGWAVITEAGNIAHGPYVKYQNACEAKWKYTKHFPHRKSTIKRIEFVLDDKDDIPT